MRVVLGKMAVGQIFLRALRFSPVSVIPTVFHTHLNLRVSLARKTGKTWEPSTRFFFPGNRGALHREEFKVLMLFLYKQDVILITTLNSPRRVIPQKTEHLLTPAERLLAS